MFDSTCVTSHTDSGSDPDSIEDFINKTKLKYTYLNPSVADCDLFP